MDDIGVEQDQIPFLCPEIPAVQGEFTGAVPDEYDLELTVVVHRSDGDLLLRRGLIGAVIGDRDVLVSFDKAVFHHRALPLRLFTINQVGQKVNTVIKQGQ